jgi:hypothetical protein
VNWRPAADEAGPRQAGVAAAGGPPAAADEPSGAAAKSSAFTSAMAEYRKLVEAAEGGGVGKGASPAAARGGGRPSRIPAYKAGAGSPGVSSGSAVTGEA